MDTGVIVAAVIMGTIFLILMIWGLVLQYRTYMVGERVRWANSKAHYAAVNAGEKAFI